MPIVEFKLGEQKFELLCEDGQQSHIKILANAIDTKMENLSRSFRGASDHLLLAITALMLEDELRVMREKTDKATNDNKNDIVDNIGEVENFLNNAILPITVRIEQLAEKLEKM